MLYFTFMKNLLEHKYTLPAILLLALILRLIPALSAISSENRLLRPDSAGYLGPAAELAQNGTYSTTRRPPGYPLLAAAVYAVGGNNTALVFVQVLISVAACAVTALAAREYAGRACGNIAACLMAANLTAIANTPLLLSDTLFALFAAGEFYLFIRYRNSKKLSHLLCCTAVAALAVLIRPINQLFLPVMITMVMILPELNWKKKLIHTASGILLFMLIITPWMLRNYLAGATFDIVLTQPITVAPTSYDY
jgi:4-amino-4-deoxy-L-arabinose transferase-like glycosyltransferase